jgi:crotonobetainyl-CoA:carnitine CoA-transferase CaiB-like acyl-CoA transferase
MKSLPLEGVLVVSIEQAVSAPFATRQLADLGARVIKVERDSGDFARAYDTKVKGEASYFVWLNRSKESLVLDLKAETDVVLLKQLIAKADVFVQNLAPGAIEKLGLGAPELLELNPQLIHVSISGYGRGGEMEKKKAYDLLIQCESGLLSVTGSPEEMSKVGISIADIASGMYAYTGVLSALLNRAKTGKGDVVEVSMLEALSEWMQQPELYARYGGAQQPRAGASHATIAPYGPFTTSDGVVFLGIQNEREWLKFCEIILGDSSIATRTEYENNSARVANRTELNTEIQDRLIGLSTRDAVSLLELAGVANAELRDMAGVANHPQLKARERWINVDTPGGEITALRPPVSSDSIGLFLSPVPTLGQHTDAIKQEILGSRNL